MRYLIIMLSIFMLSIKSFFKHCSVTETKKVSKKISLIMIKKMNATVTCQNLIICFNLELI